MKKRTPAQQTQILSGNLGRKMGALWIGLTCLDAVLFIGATFFTNAFSFLAHLPDLAGVVQRYRNELPEQELHRILVISNCVNLVTCISVLSFSFFSIRHAQSFYFGMFKKKPVLILYFIVGYLVFAYGVSPAHVDMITSMLERERLFRLTVIYGFSTPIFGLMTAVLLAAALKCLSHLKSRTSH